MLQTSRDLPLPVLHSDAKSDDVISLCDIIATEFEASTSCQTRDSSTLK